MRIEFWVDYLCPVTYLAHKNLLEAIEELNITEYEIFYRSYMIDEELFNHLKHEEKTKIIVKENLPHLKDYKYFNTISLHQLAHLAKWEGKAEQYTTKVLDSIFMLEKDLTSEEELVNVANQVGLDIDEINNVLETCCYERQINNNKINAKSRGIEFIPHLRINVKYNFKGLYEKDDLIKELKKIVEEANNPSTECAGELCAY